MFVLFPVSILGTMVCTFCLFLFVMYVRVKMDVTEFVYCAMLEKKNHPMME